MADPLEDGDIKRHIWSLPTREDLELFTVRVEKAFTEDIAQLKTDTSHLGTRLETLEQTFDDELPVRKLTVMQHRTLRPLLAAVQEAGLTYRWGFPFCL